MSSFQTLLIAAAGLLLSACLSPTRAGDLPIRTLAKAAFSGIQDPKQEVIKDKAAWEKLWTHAMAKTQNAPPRPNVDFTKEMVVAAAMGRQKSGGYSIEITRVKPSGGKLEIQVACVTPRPGAMALQALTAPVHIVAVPRNDLEPVFVQGAPPDKPKP